MSVERVLLGSAAVVGARKRAGLTQEQLAERAGLSVRALRDLELGRVRRPRRSTLDLISASVGLTETQAAALHEAWCADGGFHDFAEMIHVEGDIAALMRLEISQRELRQLLHFEKVVIGPDRRLSRSHTVMHFEALEPKTTTRSIVWGGDMIHSASAAQLTAVAGAAVTSRTVLPDLDLVVFTLTFPEPLAVGMTHTLSYDLVFDESNQPGNAHQQLTPEVTQEIALGFRRPVECHILHIVFDGCPPPLRAWEIREGTVGGWRNWQPGRPVPVAANSIEYHRANAVTGVHGLLWEW
jgi:transcriptional regulator with XRE-family HTH domain